MSPLADAIEQASPSFTGQLPAPSDSSGQRECPSWTTGIAGLSLGGGIGWLMSKYGLALDNLRSAELVTADGTVVRASLVSDEAIRTLLRSFEACPSPMSHIIIEHVHGAATRVPVASTACTLRTTGFNVVIISEWTSAADTARGVAWARDTFSALTPYLAPTRYVNYLEEDAVDPVAVAYGPNLGRLRELKARWDPDNFFRQNVNILPASKRVT